jgi:ferredoxin
MELLQSEADAADGFDPAKTRSKWRGAAGETRAVFVDENTCIGCKQCVWAAPAMFRLEPLHGRSQVWGQWLNDEEAINTAVDACPVSCIHWVDREQLPVLEHVMERLPRVNVGIMAAGQGGAVPDVFSAAVTFVKLREEAAARREKARAARRAAEAAAAAETAASGARGGARGRVEERLVGSMLARWQAATGWAWDPQQLRERGTTIPITRALVPIISEEGRSRRRISQEALDAALQAGLMP